MITLAALLFLADASPKPWEMQWPKKEPYWAEVADSNDQFWVYFDDIESATGPVSYTIWLHGKHQHNPNVAYRDSLWRLRFVCDGNVTLLASTTTDAQGRSRSWDGFQVSAIRPSTIYKSLEKKLCYG